MPKPSEEWAGLVAGLFQEERPQFGDCWSRVASLFDALRFDAERRVGAGTHVDQVGRLGRLLFRDRRFDFRLGRADVDFTLTGTLLNNGGNCLGLTTLYCALAGCCELPIAPLLFEGHIVPALCDGLIPRLIDHVRKGAFWADSLVEIQHGPLGDARLVDPSQLHAIHLTNRAAFVLVPKGEYSAALRHLDLALERFPEYCGGRINKAAVLLEMGAIDDAMVELRHVFAQAPRGRYRPIALELLRRARRGRRSPAAEFEGVATRGWT